MKQLALLFVAVILLGACGRDELISEEMNDDTKQVLDIIQEAVTDNRETAMSEWDTIIEYEVKYDSKLEDKELSVDEELLESFMSDVISLHDADLTLASHNDKLQKKIDDVRHYMKTGKVKE